MIEEWKMQMDDKLLETEILKEEIGKCETVEELRNEILPLLSQLNYLWSVKINEIIETNHYTKTEFANLCGVSRQTVNKWCHGSIPRNRETFLKIGIVAHYNKDQVNRLLQRYGRFTGLYSKSLEDCICIYVIGQNHQGKEAIDKYNLILNKIQSEVFNADHEYANDGMIKTVLVDQKLANVSSDEELTAFIQENIDVFSNAFHSLYAYLQMYININFLADGSSLYEAALGQGWSSSLRQSVSQIRQNKWIPTRNKIISLGLHIGMDHDTIDEVLETAHMEKLCAKNIFESIIIFILDNAYLNDLMNAEKDDYNIDDLVVYARDVLSEFNDILDIQEFMTELNI